MTEVILSLLQKNDRMQNPTNKACEDQCLELRWGQKAQIIILFFLLPYFIDGD